MKLKLATILIASWYALLTVGVQVHMHYCEGELAHVALNTSGNEDSGCCLDKGCEDNEGCCSFEDVFLVLDEDHKQPTELFSFAIIDLVLVPIQQVDNQVVDLPQPELFHTDTGPPLFLMNCAFTFYG